MKRVIAGAVIAASALLGLAACGSNIGPADDPGTGATDAGNGDVARIVTVDGVQCVVINGYRSTAVSCNWEAYNSK